MPRRRKSKLDSLIGRALAPRPAQGLQPPRSVGPVNKNRSTQPVSSAQAQTVRVPGPQRRRRRRY